ALLRRVLLKRSLSATSLVTTKKRPFDVFAEGPKFDQSRGSLHGIETPVQRFIEQAIFGRSPQPR
ncbi:MAG: hypothetical protein V2I43_15255, partial [Parvularcula sp.]|nr:hypothetical protein [Parvularcula sp.]